MALCKSEEEENEVRWVLESRDWFNSKRRWKVVAKLNPMLRIMALITKALFDEEMKANYNQEYKYVEELCEF